MAQTQVVIVYSPNLNKRRTVIIPDDDTQVNVHKQNIVQGESAYVGLLTDYRLIGPDAMLAQHTGLPAISDRCAIIKNNIVIGICPADPLIDAIPGSTLMLSTSAMVGWSLINGVLTAPLQPPVQPPPP